MVYTYNQNKLYISLYMVWDISTLKSTEMPYNFEVPLLTSGLLKDYNLLVGTGQWPVWSFPAFKNPLTFLESGKGAFGNYSDQGVVAFLCGVMLL